MLTNLLYGFIGLVIGVIFMALAWENVAREKDAHIKSRDQEFCHKIQHLEERCKRQECELLQLDDYKFMIDTYRKAYDYPAHGHVVYNGLEYAVNSLFSNEPTGDEPKTLTINYVQVQLKGRS